ncbi:PREDICTED: uncharacterized protein LOC105147755 [Acromyrmex echinatior]|uniref:uncharacterized protein LOC105147755 n=1 Tax=Acromyrmex echinatior TaxID=103372 RepID=UPI000580E454|nr:PREDICTED: uncharacterized protein LOC105147755 [Acromyrmex echinatior]
MREHHLLPPYLVAAVEDYFRDRQLKFHDKRRLQQRRDMSCGVPQGCWAPYFGTSHTTMFRATLPPDCHVVCYADDMLVVAGGTTWKKAVGTANVAVACVVGSVRELGLRVAPAKMEALFFHDGKRGVPPQAHIVVDDVRVPVRPTIKYLGFTVDGRWGFVEHFDELAPRLGRRADALLGLMPNLRGPNESVRRAYMHVVLSGAPVWCGKALASRCKEPTARCRHCDEDRDTAQEACPAWAGERDVLVREIGDDLSLPAVVRAIIGGERAWKAFSSFCDRVMSQKEEAKRQRE